MRNVGYLHCVALALGVAALVCLSGCGSADVEQEEAEVAPTPAFADGQGQAASGVIAYPAGPFGVGVGSVVANYQFTGFGDYTADPEAKHLIQMADFYNPTGNEVYPDDTAYPGKAGTPKPKALLIDIAASWCGPCQDEAANVLPLEYKKYHPNGGEFLLQLAEGPTYEPATMKNLAAWTKTFKVNYPASIDPTLKLSALFIGNFFPTNILIDTKTMKIVRVVSGAPDDTFWTKYEALLDAP